MVKLIDYSGNLFCGNPDAMNSITNLNYGVYTYKKINKIYAEKCKNNQNMDAPLPSYTLTDVNFKNETPISAANYTDSCTDLRSILASCDKNISNSADNKAAEIRNYKDLYLNTYKNELNTNYKNVVTYRNRLDQSAMQLMGLDKSLYEKQNIVDSAVFTTLLWTALATSVLYYAFTKL